MGSSVCVAARAAQSASSRILATHPTDPEEIREVDRQLNEALRDCDELMLRANRLLRSTGQDNDPPDDPEK
jgi:hypothetical protein